MNQWTTWTLAPLPSDYKSSKTILPISRLQDAMSWKVRQNYLGAQSTIFSRVKSYATTIFHKNCCHAGRKWRCTFCYWPWVKVEWVCGNGVNTTSKGSIAYIWLLSNEVFDFLKKHWSFLLKQFDWCLVWQVVIHWANLLVTQHLKSQKEKHLAILWPRFSLEQNWRKKRSTAQKNAKTSSWLFTNL